MNKILNKRVKKNKFKYLIQWIDLSAYENYWKSKKNLNNIFEVIKKFENERVKYTFNEKKLAKMKADKDKRKRSRKKWENEQCEREQQEFVAVEIVWFVIYDNKKRIISKAQTKISTQNTKKVTLKSIQSSNEATSKISSTRSRVRAITITNRDENRAY